jgi:hypothetical protein
MNSEKQNKFEEWVMLSKSVILMPSNAFFEFDGVQGNGL